MEEELKLLGLTENEAKIYIFLLKAGESTTGPIIKNTNIVNSRVYESINSLISKGFVSYNLQKDGKHFKASSPKVIKQKQEEKQKKIDELIPELIKLQNTTKEDTITAVYEGYEGFKTAFRKIIEDCPTNGTIHIIGFSKQQYSSDILRTFITNMNLKSSEKQQKLKIILDKESKQKEERIKEKYSEIRYMPKGYVSPSAIDIFEDYVYTFLWEEKPYVFMIKNKKIAESYKNYFNLLWKQAKP